MRERLSNSFKTKLLILFLLISAVPLVVAVSLSAFNMISDAKKNIESEGVLRNRLVQEKISELYERNLNVLRVLSASPIIRRYLLSGGKERVKETTAMLDRANTIFKDENNIIVTDKGGQQLIRTDKLPLVNVLQRWYFWQAMSGKEAVSEVVISLATGRFISVVEVPIISETGEAIGLIQRDYDLSQLQNFVRSLATENTRVWILDRDGKLIAHSSHAVETEKDRVDANHYEFVGRALAGEDGNVNAVIDGEETFVSYSRNHVTGWAIVTIQSGAYIHDKIYNGAFMAGTCGVALLLLIGIAAYLLSDKIAQPIIDLNKTVLNFAGRDSSKKNNVPLSGDELKQMATAFSHLQISAHKLRHESETDNLTQLYNKGTLERLCRESLKNLDEDNLGVMYVVDLDHFKEANDTKGHQFGDLILKKFAGKLKEVLQNAGYIGRFGGDEFVIFIPNVTSRDTIKKIAVKIMQIARTLEIENKPAEITASIGVSVFPEDGTDYKTLFDMADKSLYQVKRKNRDGYCINREEVFH